MDAYEIYHKIEKLWQKLAKPGSAVELKKHWGNCFVYVNDKKVIDVVEEQGKIRLITDE